MRIFNVGKAYTMALVILEIWLREVGTSLLTEPLELHLNGPLRSDAGVE